MESPNALSERVVAPKAMGPLHRLFGSVGVDKDGTEFEIEHVDPFVMCDYVRMQGGLVSPPFCAHPHSGIAVATVLVQGIDMRPWDNLQGYEKEKVSAGGLYVVCTGQGCVHDEGPDPIMLDRTSRRAPFGFPGEDTPAETFRMFQLWFDPGHIHASGGPPPASTLVVSPEAVPLLSAEAMKLRVLIGEYGGAQGVNMPLTVLHCGLLPFCGPGRLCIPAGVNGFLFAMERGARVSGAAGTHVVPAEQELLLPAQDEAYELTVEVDVSGEGPPGEAQADTPLELLVGFGVPVGKPWYKLLGYGGAMVAATEANVRELMVAYERDPRRFGASAEGEKVDMTRYGLQEGYKSPMDGRGECQRIDAEAPAPSARFFLVENGPYQPKGKGKGS
eukprot:TRINITY_DN76202_c0_g1_i1.p1 TRINITY_DN76202_c0_g1~~TRINITY_DN76202_c0_g1_i1.p1  ORF type:complete len:389 (+),score=57.93 TRINITY_DN76202_c0_g1_i1:69-1235(+)